MIHARWADGRLVWLKAEASVRRRRWKVTVTYQTPEGPQRLVVEPKSRCMLADITPVIDAAIREDAAKSGGVWAITWDAVGR